MSSFFSLRTLPQAQAICERAFVGIETARQTVAYTDALDRVLARDVDAPDPVPHFARSVVDGYAVRSADTAAASASQPTYLEVVGEVTMGRPTGLELSPGQAAVVPTGGMLPAGADAAVMIEHTERVGPTMIEVGRAAPPGTHVIDEGEDVSAGERCLRAGSRLGPAELALLATVGVTEVEVFTRPVVALLSTGDEVVDPERRPGPAEVRDANRAGLCGMVRRAGAEPRFDGIVRDVRDDLAAGVKRALETSDCLLVSGGSSVGDRDHAIEAIDGAGPPGVLLHGIAMKPGKPTIVGLAGRKPVFGLPGHPLSAMVSFFRVVRPVIQRLGGQRDLWEPTATARLTRKVPSDPGRTEYVRVRLAPQGAEIAAEPLFGKSAALSSLVAARGLVEIPLGVEGLDEGSSVPVLLL